MALPQVGKVAPAFTLRNQDGEKVSLKDFRGKKNVLVYFYDARMHHSGMWVTRFEGKTQSSKAGGAWIQS